jgi:hypothetical protein
VLLYTDSKQKAILLRQVQESSLRWKQKIIDLGFVSFHFFIVMLIFGFFFFNDSFFFEGRVDTPFQIVFESVKPLNIGFLGIDDISFEYCSLPALPTANETTCMASEYKCKRGNCVSIDRLCDFVDDCGDFTDELLTICASFTRWVKI